MFMNDTNDPLCPYDDGEIKVELWLEHNNLSGPPKVTRLPDLDPDDGAVVERSVWSDERRSVLSDERRSVWSDERRSVLSDESRLVLL